MNVVPRKWDYLDGAPLKVHSLIEDGKTRGLIVECTVVQPPSAVGRTVNVYFDNEEVTKALLEFRDSAREARK